MPWGDPIASSKAIRGEPGVSASVKSVNGNLRMIILLNTALMIKIDEPRKCHIQPGTDDDKYKLLLTFTESGNFIITKRVQNKRCGGTIMLPPPYDGICSEWELPNLQCELITYHSLKLTIKLPMGLWEKAVKELETEKE